MASLAAGAALTVGTTVGEMMLERVSDRMIDAGERVTGRIYAGAEKAADKAVDYGMRTAQEVAVAVPGAVQSVGKALTRAIKKWKNDDTYFLTEEQAIAGQILGSRVKALCELAGQTFEPAPMSTREDLVKNLEQGHAALTRARNSEGLVDSVNAALQMGSTTEMSLRDVRLVEQLEKRISQPNVQRLFERTDPIANVISSGSYDADVAEGELLAGRYKSLMGLYMDMVREPTLVGGGHVPLDSNGSKLFWKDTSGNFMPPAEMEDLFADDLGGVFNMKVHSFTGSHVPILEVSYLSEGELEPFTGFNDGTLLEFYLMRPMMQDGNTDSVFTRRAISRVDMTVSYSGQLGQWATLKVPTPDKVRGMWSVGEYKRKGSNVTVTVKSARNGGLGWQPIELDPSVYEMVHVTIPSTTINADCYTIIAPVVVMWNEAGDADMAHGTILNPAMNVQYVQRLSAGKTGRASVKTSDGSGGGTWRSVLQGEHLASVLAESVFDPLESHPYGTAYQSGGEIVAKRGDMIPVLIYILERAKGINSAEKGRKEYQWGDDAKLLYRLADLIHQGFQGGIGERQAITAATTAIKMSLNLPVVRDGTAVTQLGLRPSLAK